MPYDPDDLYTAEPKLLSLDCFPVFFSQPAPPDYDLIMASSTHYHRVEDPRASMESSAETSDDTGLLLLDTLGSDDGDTPPSRGHKFSCHPTLFLRLIAVCVLIPSFVLFVLAQRPRSLSATTFVCVAIVRNALAIFHHLVTLKIRIRFSIELRSRAPRATKPRRSCPEWLKQGPLHLLLDLILVSLLLITTIIATSGSYDWRRGSHADVALPACILAYIGFVFYLVSIFDMGKPSNITVTGGISFNYGKEKDGEQREQPQVYRDVEASAVLPVQAGKTRADSPVIV